MKVLFYPDKGDRKGNHSLCKQRVFCDYLGLEIINNPFDDFDFAVYLDLYDINRPEPILYRIEEHKKVVNLHCNNLDRFYIDEVFTEVFGYSSLAKTGERCVKKENCQGGGHYGVIMECPAKKDEGFIYQKFIDCRINEDTIRVIRPVIFGRKIKALIIKESDSKDPFEQNDKISKEYFYNKKDWIFFSDYEIKQMEQVAERLGLDYGEYDVVRDKDNRIYIIDVNNIPGSKVFGRLSNGDYALKTMAHEFYTLLKS